MTSSQMVTMVGLKRKESPSAKNVARENLKKIKTEAKTPHRPAVPPPDLEAETDSDPIIESDTTEHSGDDDGVSWPSDDGEIIPPVTKSRSTGKDGGGAKLPIVQSKLGVETRVTDEGSSRKNNR